MLMRRVLLAAILGSVLSLGWATGADVRADEGRIPVVLELFTSQGCSSCPPADAFLGEIADMRDDVLALAFHVDYWDYIGWKDRFATKDTTARQRKYAQELGLSYVYTPQMVVDGAAHVVGSDEMAVIRAIETARKAEGTKLPVSVMDDGSGGIEISIPEAAFDGDAVVWLVNFDREHSTEVTAGENTGRTMVNYHVVRNYRQIGTWSGTAVQLALSADEVMAGPEGEGCAVLVQSDGNGRIIGAAALDFMSAGS